MQVNVAINRGAARTTVPHKSVDDTFTKALLTHTSDLIVTQSRDDDNLVIKEVEARSNKRSNEQLVECSEESNDDDDIYDWQNVMEQIRADPSLARVEREGVLPLHAACGAGAPINVVKMLLKIYPQAAQAKSDNGYLPLMCHLLLNTESPSEEVVSALLESYPGAAAVVDENNQLPIHIACMATGVSKHIFTMLLRAHPGGAYVADVEGYYPVDYAAANKDVVTRKVALASLIANDPEEFRGQYIEEKDETRDVTLVDLLLNGPGLETKSELVNLTDDIIQDILTSFTFSDEMQDAPYLKRATSAELASVSNVIDEKSLLLHLEQCIENGSSPSQAIVTTLMESYPTSARVSNAKNQFPIHLACKAAGVSESMFTMMLRAYPQGAYACDVDAMCPIDYAVSNKDLSARKAAIAALVESDKQVHMHAPTATADLSPQPAISERSELSSSFINKEEQSPAVEEKTLLHHLEHCLEHNWSPSEAIVAKIIESYPSSTRVANAKNQLPIHLACMATGVSETVLILLLGAYPEAAFVCDGNGLFPIDYAVVNKDVTTRKTAIAALSQNDSVVKFMRASSAPIKPGSSPMTSEEDEVGFWACGNVDNVDDYDDEEDINANALHEVFACNSSPPEDIVLSVIESNPGVVRVFDDLGQLPLHHACMAKRVSVNTFAYILEAYPEGAYVPDKVGKYPIDYAAENLDAETRINAIAALLQNDATKGLTPKRVEDPGCIGVAAYELE